MRLKYYTRYADDIFVVVEDKEKAKQVLLELQDFIENNLHLKTNDKKTKIFPIEQGVNALGYKIYKTHMLLRDSSKKKIKRKAKKMRRLLVEGKMTKEKAEQILNSWHGHAKHACSYNFINRLIERNDYIYRSGDNLKVNMDKVRDYNVIPQEW